MRNKIVLAYKTPEKTPGLSHVGLGVCALNICKVLAEAGLNPEVWPVFDGFVLRDKLRADTTVRDVILFAPWMDTPFLHGLVREQREVTFAMVCHSNIAFLQADRWAMKIIREEIALEQLVPNFHVAGNSIKFCNFIREAYGAECAYLPNLYSLEGVKQTRSGYRNGVLRLGIFGATRQLKNIMTAAGAALLISERLGVETEIFVSTGREEGGYGVMDSVRQMLMGKRRATLIESTWQPWQEFRETCRYMHLMLQPSFTETFNIVTADGIAVGVPSVVSESIDWVPPRWTAHADDPGHIAEIGIRLLKDPGAASQGLQYLRKYNRAGLQAWFEYLAL